MKGRFALVAHWDWVLHHFRLPVARALRDQGADITFICPRGKYVPALENHGFKWLPWKVDRRSINPFSEAFALRDLIRTYKRERFTLVHHFTAKPNLYGTIAAHRATIPVVINTVSGLGFLFSDVPVARVLYRMLVPVMRRSFSASNVWTIFQNRADLRLFVDQRLSSHPGQTRLIEGTGVDLDVFGPAAVASNRSRPVVIMASRLIREKGVEQFAAAAEALPQCEFVLAGETDPGNPSSLDEAIVDGWKRAGAIRVLGHRADMDVLLKAADIAVLPTYYPEGVPRFLLEAAASGLPLVASDIPPCRAVVQDGLNGFLVPVKDEERLIEAIGKLAEDPELRTRFGAAGREIVEDRFSQQKIVGEYLDLYRDVLSVQER